MDQRNVLVIGSGGREHAIVWKLSRSNHVKTVFVAPGSYAIGQVEKTKVVDVDVKNFEKVADWCKLNDVGLVTVGPEDPLADGIADVLSTRGIKVFGPCERAARIESDKNWAKSFMDRHGIPTARWKSFDEAKDAKDFINNADFPALVVKASGLAAGKGVSVAQTKEEACGAVDEILISKKFGCAGETVVIEELLEGEEVSVLAFCDGATVRPMLPAQDHKRIFDNDLGPNTGGMGAYCPCPLITDEEFDYVKRVILEQTVTGLNRENIKFTGILYAGLMLTKDGPKVLEFNCRFGDPETEVILPLLQNDLYEVISACCDGTLRSVELKWRRNFSSVGVVMASRGYPETSSKGQVITGLGDVTEENNCVIFHCGTAFKNGNYVTNGGRVLIAVCLAPQLSIAASRSVGVCNLISFDGAQYRNDIAHKGIARAILSMGKLTYKASGVDITAGNDLVSHIKPCARLTDRVGVLGGLGGFGGLFDVGAAGFRDPILVSGTDGVGTKLKIAQEMNIHNTIGIDLVAMCANDVLAHGAEPLFFLDYFACGKLDIDMAKQVITGIAEGCKQAGCSLLGGETAEMPDMYPAGEYDLAGFAVGAVERTRFLPTLDKIREDDVVIGLPSSGVHSNGFSLVRRVMKITGLHYKDPAPFGQNNKTIGEELLEPTRIYVRHVIAAMKTGKVKAFAHITGGGLIENIPRVLPPTFSVELDARKWDVPPVFAWLAAAGGIGQSELLRTFNCGIGAVLMVDRNDAEGILKVLSDYDPKVIGVVTDGKGDAERVAVNHVCESLERKMRRFLAESETTVRKRTAVLISGGGTNLQALIDATGDPTRRIGAEIVLVISNKSNVEGLKRAERAKIPTKVLNHKDYATRVEFDRVMHDELVASGVEIVCLAGFMRILSGEFTAKWRGKLLNVHPALLPSFKGTHAQRQALEAGVRISGCSVHFVEEDVDAGAIIVQEAVEIIPGDTEESLTERIKLAEHRAFPHALQLVATGRVTLGDNNRLIWSRRADS